VRRRRYLIIGDGGGITWFIHPDAAAAVTVLALEHDGSAIYNITR
jgi:nucleoside-diphosphate-sugar epimerase